jgi:competence protein ComEC
VNNWVKNITLSQSFFWFCVTFLIGVTTPFFWTVPGLAMPILLLIVLLFVVVSIFLKRVEVLLITVLLTGFLFGIARGSANTTMYNHLAKYAGEEVLLNGSITTPPLVKSTYQSFRFHVKEIAGKDSEINQQIFVILSVDQPVSLSDKLQLDCTLEPSRDGEGYICTFPRVVSQIAIDPTTLKKIYDGFVSTLLRVYSQPEAGFITGILVGGTALFSDTLIEQFRITGTLHLVALSGFNISIIVGFLTIVYERLAIPRRWYAVSTAGLLALFVMFVGPAASIVRASIMGFLVVVARQRGRYVTPRNVLAFTAVVMVAVSPDILLHDLGFQLSFLATVGIVYLSPILESKLKFIPNIWQFREALLLAISAELMVIPLLIWNFSHVSIVSPLVNMIIGPLIPVAMLFGFIGGVAGILSISLGQALGLLGWLITHVILEIISWFASLPLAYVPWTIPGPLLILYYFLLYYWINSSSQAKFVRRV